MDDDMIAFVHCGQRMPATIRWGRAARRITSCPMCGEDPSEDADPAVVVGDTARVTSTVAQLRVMSPEERKLVLDGASEFMCFTCGEHDEACTCDGASGDDEAP